MDDLYNIPIGNVKKVVPNFFEKEKYVLHYETLKNPLAPDKTEIKREMLSDYQLKMDDLYNIPIGKIKKLVPNFFEKEKYVLHYKTLKP